MAARFRLLGGVEAECDGVPVELGHAKQRGVFAVLLVEANQLVTIDRLLDCVWGEPHPPRGRDTLYSYLSRLRTALPVADEVQLVRRSGGYRLAVDEQSVDLHRFRHLIAQSRTADDEQTVSLLEQALELWRGAPLGDLDTPWANGLRATLQRELLAAELDHADAALRRGRHADLLPALAERAQRHPLDERAAGQLMVALHCGGRQADALEHYEHVRTRLVEELGTDPGSGLQRLYRRILANDPDPAASADTTAPATTAPSSVPRQLPAPPRLFTGRTGELATLTTALESAAAGEGPTVVISALSGSGGIGKTWLALHWAHHHLDRFPDGQLFVDMHGFSPTGRPMAPEDALRGFLGALGATPDRVPADLDARAALFRSLLAGKRMLVVLDNVAGAGQVVPLLPGSPSCTVLVTSRNRLPRLIARHGARPLPLGVLTDTEAHALLTTSLGTGRDTPDEAAVAELIGLCGGFPLALGLIAARTRHHLTPAEAVAELRQSGLDALDADDPTASLPAVLSWSLRHLTDEQQRVFALLAISPGPDIGLPAAAGLTGLPAREARAVLRALADASLLNLRPDGRYAMHDLVRAYATTLANDLPEPVRRSALARVVDFYLHTAHTADRLLEPHRQPIRLDQPAPDTHPLADIPAALAWLDTEHTNLLAAQHTAATHQRHQVVWQLAWTLTTFHYRRGHHHDDVTVWQTALDAAEHLPDPATRTLAHRLLGTSFAELGRHKEATGHLHQALALAERQHDPAQQAHTHHLLARAGERQGDDRKALEHARHALDLYRTLDNPVWEAFALNDVGWYAARVGDYDTAREHCRAALALHRRHDHAEGEANTLDSLGWIDFRTGRHQEAVDHYRRALTSFRALDHTTEVANTLDHLGHPYAALGRTDQARAVWQEALELCREQGRDADAVRVRRQLDGLDNPSPAGTS